MDNYKTSSGSKYIYGDKEKFQKETDDEDEIKEYVEKEAIQNLCNNEEIQESLETLIDLSSDPYFTFTEELPSQIITVICEQLKNPSVNSIILLRCLEFIANLWKLPLLIDDELLELIVSLSFQTKSIDIASFGFLSISNLIEATTKEGDDHFGVDNLDQLLFPQTPEREEIDFDKLVQLLSFLDADSEEFISIILDFILNITRVYKADICQTIFSDDEFVSLLNALEAQNLILLIIRNLVNDKKCVEIIFTPEFTTKFIDLTINSSDPEVILNAYSILSVFPQNGSLINYLKNADLWESIKNNMNELSQYDLTPLMHLIYNILFIDEHIIEEFDFWPSLFEISDEFSITNKEGFANVLSQYFVQSINVTSEEPPPYSVDGGFEFLCEILEYVKNPMIFINISMCLINLVSTYQDEFGPILSEINIVNKLLHHKMDLKKDSDEQENSDLLQSISDFISTISMFTLQS